MGILVVSLTTLAGISFRFFIGINAVRYTTLAVISLRIQYIRGGRIPFYRLQPAKVERIP